MLYFFTLLLSCFFCKLLLGKDYMCLLYQFNLLLKLVVGPVFKSVYTR